MKKSELNKLIETTVRKQLKEVRNFSEADLLKALDQAKQLSNDNKADEATKVFNDAYKKYNANNGQYYNIIKILTDASGYWYVGSSQASLEKKLKSLAQEDYTKFRTEMAKLLNKMRHVDNAMEEVKKQAGDLLKKLE
jgi:hypothetical protein